MEQSRQHDSQGLQDQEHEQQQQTQQHLPPPPQQVYQQDANHQSQQYDNTQNGNQNQNQNQYQYQPQQPYPQFLPQQYLNQPPHVSPKSMWISKLTLRIISSIFCIVVIGLGASNASSGSDLASIIVFGPPAGLAFCWNVAEIICIWARGGHRGIHPGACVALDLIIWLGWLITIVMFAICGYLVDSSNWYSGYYGDESDYDSSFQRQINIGRASFALAILLLFLHLALFVIACCETSIRSKRYPQIIYVQAPPGMAMNPGMNHQSVMFPQGYQVPSGYQPQMMYPPQPQYVKPQETPATQENPPTAPSPVHSSNRYA